MVVLVVLVVVIVVLVVIIVVLVIGIDVQISLQILRYGTYNVCRGENKIMQMKNEKQNRLLLIFNFGSLCGGNSKYHTVERLYL